MKDDVDQTKEEHVDDHINVSFMPAYIENNAEALRRLMRIVAHALPHTQPDVQALLDDWQRIHERIVADHQDELEGKL